MSDNVIAEKLDDCIEQHLDAMARYNVGSEEMRTAINDLVRLYKFRIDEAKLDFDYSNKDDQHELDVTRVTNDKGFKESQLKLEEQKFELEKKRVNLDETDKLERRNIDKERLANDCACEKEQVKEQRVDRYFKLGIAAAELVLPLTVYSVLAMLGYAREFDGVITSATLKRVTNDIKFKK